MHLPSNLNSHGQSIDDNYSLLNVSTMLPGHNTMLPGKNTMLLGQNTMLLGQNTMLPGQNTMLPSRNTQMIGDCWFDSLASLIFLVTLIVILMKLHFFRALLECFD